MGGDDERWEHTAAGLREQYTLLLGMLASYDPAEHPAPALDELDDHARAWGLPSPYRATTQEYARRELTRLGVAEDRDERLLQLYRADRQP